MTSTKAARAARAYSATKRDEATRQAGAAGKAADAEATRSGDGANRGTPRVVVSLRNSTPDAAQSTTEVATAGPTAKAASSVVALSGAAPAAPPAPAARGGSVIAPTKPGSSEKATAPSASVVAPAQPKITPPAVKPVTTKSPGTTPAAKPVGAKKKPVTVAVPVPSGVAASAMGTAALVVALSSAGVAIVAAAYALARAGHSGASLAYWVGQVVVFLPAVVWVLGRRTIATGEAFLVTIGLALNMYALKWAYSPDQFKFPDELQHWAATTILVKSGLLFQRNTALPAAVHFPGLEEMGGAVVSLTGLSVTTAGLIVAGLAHLVMVGALFLVVRRTGGTARLAALTCVIYATGLHYLFFDSMYLYQTAALPFLLLAVWASRIWRPREWRTWPFGLLGVVSIAVVTVSHHVSALVLVGTLGLLALVDLVIGRPRRWGTAILAGVAFVFIGCWLAFVARDVLSYLTSPLQSAVDAALRLVGGSDSTAKSDSSTSSPLWSLALQAIGLLGLLSLFASAAWRAFRSRVRDPWRLGLLVGTALFFAGSALRFLGSQGPELAGRAATFTYLPMSMLGAVVLVTWRGHRQAQPRPVRRRWLARLVGPVPIGVLMIMTLMVGARVGGWPPAYEQLPGKHLVAGYERSIDSTGVAAAYWTREYLGTGNRVAADTMGGALVSSYGGQDPVDNAGELWDDKTWGLADEQILQNLAINYLWVDMRLASSAPVSGALFQNETTVRPTALTTAQLTKFDSLTGASLVYDNGDIRIYNVSNA